MWAPILQRRPSKGNEAQALPHKDPTPLPVWTRADAGTLSSHLEAISFFGTSTLHPFCIKFPEANNQYHCSFIPKMKALTVICSQIHIGCRANRPCCASSTLRSTPSPTCWRGRGRHRRARAVIRRR